MRAYSTEGGHLLPEISSAQQCLILRPFKFKCSIVWRDWTVIYVIIILSIRSSKRKGEGERLKSLILRLRDHPSHAEGHFLMETNAAASPQLLYDPG